MRAHNRLDRQAWLLIGINALHAFSYALSNTFVNVYLWKIEQNLKLIALFHFFQYTTIAITFILAGWVAKRYDRVVSIRIGVVLESLFYLLVLILGTQSVRYVIGLGSFAGIGHAFYWLAYNVLYFEITERETRDYFNGVNGLFQSLAGIIAPFLSGIIITKIDQFTGYRIIFALSLFIFLVAVIMSYFLDLRAAKGAYSLSEVWQLLGKTHRHWYWVNLATLSQGLREGVFLFVTSILVYFVSRNEFTVGSFYTVTSLVSLFAYFLAGKILTPSRRNKAILIGSLMMGIMLIPFLISMNTWTVMLYGIGCFFFYPFYFAPLTSTVYDLIGASKRSVAMRVEYVVSRELVLNLGRMLGVFSFILWQNVDSGLEGLRYFLFFFGFIQVLAWVFIRRVPILIK